MWKTHFEWEKTTRQTLNKFIVIKSIRISSQAYT